MDKGAKRRWVILLSLLAMTVAAIFYPVKNEQATVSTIATSQKAKPVVTAMVSAENQQLEALGTDADPFAPRGWQAPPPPALAPQAAPIVAALIQPPAPSGPPPLPFRFMGRMNDAGEEVVYLSHGDQMLLAHNGDLLEGTYKVLSIDAQHIEFEQLATGDKQTLTITASEN